VLHAHPPAGVPEFENPVAFRLAGSSVALAVSRCDIADRSLPYGVVLIKKPIEQQHRSLKRN
jgi:hypothetical protein